MQISIERLESVLSVILSDRYEIAVKVKAVKDEKSCKDGNGNMLCADTSRRVGA